MKVDEFKKEITLLSVADLKEKLNQMRKELFSMRLKAAVTHLKDHSHFFKLRGNIARVLTVLRQKEMVSKQA
ncbi:MAG: 50S ribosomal protein L29 [Candidatus Dependentiae bacterium]|nr:50S ribosomal protein L29 [Candidatus Dependentiae bacterium]